MLYDCELRVGTHNNINKMGNNPIGETIIAYKTKDDVAVKYIYYDLKGKNRFPPLPQNEDEVNLKFEQCLKQIQAPREQLQLIRDFNSKYRFRFMLLHNQKLQQHREKSQLYYLRSSPLSDDPEKNRRDHNKKELEQKMKEIELPQNSIKMPLNSIERYISEKNAWADFMVIDGIRRIVSVLNRAVAANKLGTKTIFQNQIEILKFLKSLSDQHPKEYFHTVCNIPEYAITLLRAYHPVNVAVSAYVLLMLQDYAWKVESRHTILESLEFFKQQNKLKSILEPFAETIYESDNILMCYYNLRFIHEILISIVDEDEKKRFEEGMQQIKYELLIEQVKNKLQTNHYKIEYCTFIYVNQKVYKYATKTKKEKGNFQPMVLRDSVNLDVLQQHLLIQVAKEDQKDLEESLVDGDEATIIYLVETDRKNFNKFILDTFSEIQHFYKYSLLIDKLEEGVQEASITEEISQTKKGGLTVEDYTKRIKGQCAKNQCEEVMLSCFRVIQYFQKAAWAKLEQLLMNDLQPAKGNDDSDIFKRQLEEKERELKVIKRQCMQLKAELFGKGGKMKQANLSKAEKQPILLNHAVDKQKDKNSTNISTKSKYSIIPLPLINLPSTLIPSISPLPNSQINLTLARSIPQLPLQPPPSPNINSINLVNNPPLPPPPPPLTFNNICPSLPNLHNILPPPPNDISSPTKLKQLPSLPQLPAIPTFLGLPSLGPTIQEKVKEKRHPKIPLKPCNYMVLDYGKIRNSVWQNIEDTQVPLKEDQLQKYFAKAIPKESFTKIQSMINVFQAKKKEPVKIFGTDRWRNLQIVLTKLRLPEGAITQTLTQCSGKYSTNSILESIHKILPTEEEEMNIRSYEGDSQDLGKPQKFIRQLIAVPEYASRIKAMLFSNFKQEMYFEIQNHIDRLTTAFTSLKDDFRLQHILSVALAIGNYLNGTSIKGGAWGFRLDTLERIQEVKSSDNQMNAGFYLIKEVWGKYMYPIFDKEQIEMYQEISKISVPQIKTELNELKKYSLAIEKALKSKNANNTTDLIDNYCEEMLIEAKQKYIFLDKNYAKLQISFRECATYYCEDPQKGSSDQIGKRLFKGVLYIFNTEKLYYEVEERRRKEESRRAVQNEMEYKSSQATLVSTFSHMNPQRQIKTRSPSMVVPQYIPPKSVHHEMTAEQKMKEIQKAQQEKQKRFLEDMMKKRNSKIASYRQSRIQIDLGVSQNENGQIQIDFLKNL